MIKIESLTSGTLKETINLVDKVFLDQGEEPAISCFLASLNPEEYKDFLFKIHVSELRYWVAINGLEKVLGTIGLYCYEFDKDKAFWLGWFCVDPNARKKGIGSQLLQFSINEAKRLRKKFLRLYTSTDPNELDSHRLYEKHGFKLVKEEPLLDAGLKTLYYQLEL